MKRKLLLTLVTLFILACGMTTSAISDPRSWREATHYIPTPNATVAIVVTTTALPTPYTLPDTNGRKIQEWQP